MITIRKAVVEDVAQITGIFNESVTPVWSDASIQSELEKNDSYFIVAVCNDSGDTRNLSPCVLGFAVIRQVGDDGELLQIATCKTALRKGVGNALMNAIIDYSATKNFSSIFLEVRVNNFAAIKLYEKHGFKTVRIRKDYYDAPVEDAIVMVFVPEHSERKN